MKFLVVAVLENMSGTKIGYKLYNMDALTRKGKDKIQNPFNLTTEEKLIAVMKNGGAELVNVGLSGNEVVGTNGSLDRYPCFVQTANGWVIKDSRKLPIIVLNQIEEVGYTILYADQSIRKVKREVAAVEAEKLGIANGKLVEKDSLKFISAISGHYDVENVPKSNIGTNTIGINIAIPSNTSDTKSIEKSISIEVNSSINDEDIFKCMTPKQKHILKTYYVWYTVNVYKTLTKNIRLDISPTKADKLSQIRGDQEWVFAGVWDSGFRGASKCELGHPLRFEYYAKPKGVDESIDQMNSRLTKKALEKILSGNKGSIRDIDDMLVVFGDTCASDFFKIRTEDMRQLVKTRKIMSDEIQWIADVIINEKVPNTRADIRFLMDTIGKLANQDNIFKAFGELEGTFLINFLANDLPLPESLVKSLSVNARKHPPSYYSTLYPEYINEIKFMFSQDVQQIANKPFLRSFRYLLDFALISGLEGGFAYDPFDTEHRHRSEGQYNKDTRNQRLSLLSRIEHGLEFQGRSKYTEFSDFNYYFSLVGQILRAKKIIDNNKSIYDGVTEGELIEALAYERNNIARLEYEKFVEKLGAVELILAALTSQSKPSVIKVRFLDRTSGSFNTSWSTVLNGYGFRLSKVPNTTDDVYFNLVVNTIQKSDLINTWRRANFYKDKELSRFLDLFTSVSEEKIKTVLESTVKFIRDDKDKEDKKIEDAKRKKEEAEQKRIDEENERIAKKKEEESKAKSRIEQMVDEQAKENSAGNKDNSDNTKYKHKSDLEDAELLMSILENNPDSVKKFKEKHGDYYINMATNIAGKAIANKDSNSKLTYKQSNALVRTINEINSFNDSVPSATDENDTPKEPKTEEVVEPKIVEDVPKNNDSQTTTKSGIPMSKLDYYKGLDEAIEVILKDESNAGNMFFKKLAAKLKKTGMATEKQARVILDAVE